MSSDDSSEQFLCPHTESLGAYLLGGLDEDEMHLLRVHADSCSVCSAELRQLRPIADLLHASDLNVLLLGDRVEPAPDLAERLVARANAEMSESSSIVRTRLAADLAAVGRITDLDDARRRRRGRRVTMAAAAVAFALGAGSVLGVQQVAQRDDRRSTTGERIQFASVEVGGPSSATPGSADESVGAPKAWAWIDATNAGTYARLYTRGLEPETVYRWWFEKADGSRVGLGSFRFPKVQDEDWLICPGSTAVLRSELVYIGATDESGKEVLRQKLPPAPRLENA